MNFGQCLIFCLWQAKLDINYGNEVDCCKNKKYFFEFEQEPGPRVLI